MDKPTHNRRVAPFVNIIAAGAPPTLIHTISQGRTAKIKKIHLQNLTTFADVVTFGEVIAGVWTQRQAGIHAATPGSLQIGELDLPSYEYETDIYAESANAGPAAPMVVQIEVEEIG